jgi:environmental stress-induced protein Ves
MASSPTATGHRRNVTNMAIQILERLDPAAYRHVPWKNGGGVTTDIAAEYRPDAEPGSWEGTIWRLSRTRIEKPGPFSDLAGYDRLLAVIDGSGLVLHPKGRPPLDVRKPFQAVRFAGEWPIDSELTEGPVGVLNLLADRTKIAIDLSFVTAPGQATLPAAHSIVLALLPTRARLDSETVSIGRNGAISVAGPGELMIDDGLVAISTLAPVAAAR